MKSLKQQAAFLPKTPGVYRFDDASGQALYIGKAINIRRRVAQHLERPMRDGLLEGAVSVEAFDCADENASLSLEREMIGRHRPSRNIRLPSRPLMLCVTDDQYPRLVLTRLAPQKGWMAFGPYESPGQAGRLLDTLESTFMLRSCEGKDPGRQQSPCLDFFMGRCSAPCDSKVDQKQYMSQVEAAVEVLKGNHAQLSKRLEEQMQKAARARNYEQAALLRDRIQSLSKLTGKRYLVGGGSYDVVALARNKDKACLELRRVRLDQLVDVTRLRIETDPLLSDDEIMRQFLQDYAGELEATVVLSHKPQQQIVRPKPLRFVVPKKGRRLQVLLSAQAGARRALGRPGAEAEANPLDALEELAGLLSMQSLPLEIECFDISNLGARQTTGGIVRMSAGKKFESRALNLAERSKPNDVAAIGELLKRRLELESFHSRPDLMVIDGGKGQLGRAAKVMKPWTDAGMVLVSLAKKEELVYMLGRSEPLRPQGKALRILQKLRDRTHQAAISAHRRRRDRDATSSPLDAVPGIGPQRRKALIKRFGGLDEVMEASQQQLEEVLPREVAIRLRTALS